MNITLPELFWYENGSLDIEVPDEWDVELCRIKGADAPALSLEQLAAGINDPIGAPRLRELAKGKKKAVIVFDDMTRPTRVDQIGLIVVEELLEAGLSEDQISFVCALGSHGALSQVELRKKVGSEILERFRVYNHNCYENCDEVGTTERGTPVKINSEVMSADLKIGIGCVTAHAQVGFSGGGKLFLPGVAHIDSIAHYHLDVQQSDPDSTGLGNWDNNVMRFDIEEAARMVGVDFKIDVLVNERCEAAHVFAGEFMQAHEKAVKLAKQHYATSPRPRDKNLMICNAFCKPNEMTIGCLVGTLGLEGMKGTVVIIANAPEGQVVHYMLGRFGESFGGRQHPISPVPDQLIDLVIQAPHMDRTFGDWFANPEVIHFTRNWQETLAFLRSKHGEGTRVGVVPNATMCYHP